MTAGVRVTTQDAVPFHRLVFNCYLSLFPSLVIFCWRCKPSLTGGGMRDMHSRSVLHLGFVTLATGLATGFVNMRTGFVCVSSTVGG